MQEHFDVLVIGAGLSGIGMACQLAMQVPEARVGIIERRQAIGGTWDLFRYPGVRSDSDMFSFGYSFRPWNELKVLADGPSIRRYVVETAREYGVEEKIRFGLKATRFSWSSERREWTVTALEEASGQERSFTCTLLIACTGYYDYDAGYLPDFPGVGRFQGLRIHPQQWPEDLDYSGKRVVVIGSGATAVTLVPAMAERAAHVTMLQRSPSYVFSVPAYDKLSEVLRRFLPDRLVYAWARRRNIFLQRTMFKAAKRWPGLVRRLLLAGVRKRLGGTVDMRHFTPPYNPWDERLCAVPNADLFAVLREGKASVVTDRIETFTERGIRLASGRELEADIVITAIGLRLQACGGVTVDVDGVVQPIHERLTYKGVLVQDVPNFGYIFGYTNASWTLKADIAAAYLCRLYRYMRETGRAVFTPKAPEGEVLEESVMSSLRSGYVQRGQAVLPRQGRHLPWRVLHSYERDRVMLLEQPIPDEALVFSGASPVPDAIEATPTPSISPQG